MSEKDKCLEDSNMKSDVKLTTLRERLESLKESLKKITLHVNLKKTISTRYRATKMTCAQ